MINNKEYKGIKYNLINTNSLTNNWNKLFKINRFNYVIGNPPYVNTHDMKKEMITILKQNFKTTQEGIFNICYAFIEQALNNISKNGSIEFIVPNNILTIKSALKLREMLQNEKHINLIIDFSENMIFKPIRTYNCIIKLNNNSNNTFRYAIIGKNNKMKK